MSTFLFSKGMQRLVIVPLYPHYSCFRTGTMLNVAVGALDEQTIPLAKEGLPVENHRVRVMSHVSFQCSTVDRWSTHPAIIDVISHPSITLSCSNSNASKFSVRSAICARHLPVYLHHLCHSELEFPFLMSKYCNFSQISKCSV